MFGLGATELIIILVIILVLFGPKQLPKIGKMLGQTTRQLREGLESGAAEETEPKPEAKKKPKPVTEPEPEAEAEDEEEPEATPKTAESVAGEDAETAGAEAEKDEAKA